MLRGVEFWPFPLTCFVAFKTLSVVRVCDVGRVAVKNCFKLLSFLHLYLLFYYNFLTVLIMRVGMFNKGINCNSGLKYLRYRRIQRPRLPIKALKL